MRSSRCRPERDACARRRQSGHSGGPHGDATGNNVLVTGSRIARPNFDTDAPAVIISSEQIENRGFETLGQAINEQPAFGVPGASPVGAAQAGSFGSGQSFVNFLGLGDQRTLVLVNGRRFVSSNTASIFGPSNSGLQVDLNEINTRPRRQGGDDRDRRRPDLRLGRHRRHGEHHPASRLSRLELDAQYGISEQGDAPNYRVRGIWGMNFGDGRGNVTPERRI